MSFSKDSKIVEVFSKQVLHGNADQEKLKGANDYIKELASNPNPNNRYEIAQIMSFIMDEGLRERVNYFEAIADVKRTGINEKAQFKIGVDGVKAMFQAKSASTERSKVSNKFVTLDTEEVSVRPVVNFLDLQSGKTDLVKVAAQAVTAMEMAIVKRIQDSVYAAFSSLASPNYAQGSGVARNTFNPILHAMTRVGGSASVVGDIEVLSKFTELVGFSGDVPDALAIEHNENGMIGRYLGANLMKLNNPFVPNSLTQTELRKDLVYVIPNGDEALRPVKVQFEGGVQTTDAPVNINSKEVEFRFDQYVGVGVLGVRKLLGIYEDTTL